MLRGGRKDAFNQGANATLTATANTGYSFSGWYENGAKIPIADTTYSFIVTANRTLEARFTQNQIQNQFTINAMAGVGGKVTGGGTYKYGENVTLTTAPNSGYRFEGWYESGKKLNGVGTAYNFIATNNRELTAQ